MNNVETKIDRSGIRDLEEQLDSIIDRLPKEYKVLIEQSFTYKRVPKEYLLSAMLFTVSSSAGLTFYLKSLGYTNYGNCYFAIIGSRGDTKSEAINIATNVLKISDDKDYDLYLRDALQLNDNETAIVRKQVLLQNASIESAQKTHYDNQNGIGICRDEIFDLIENMANPKSRDGIAWRTFFLESYTNGHIDISRKTTDSFRIKKTYATLLGGLQHQFIPKLFANGNLESGFIDRVFFTSKITTNNTMVKGQLKPSAIANYENCINNILAYKKQGETNKSVDQRLEITIDEQSQELIFEYTQQLINRKEKAPRIIKEYFSKMMIAIHKLCIIAFMINHSKEATFKNELSLSDVHLAIELNEFYLSNFQSIVNSSSKSKLTSFTIDDVIRMAQKNNSSQKAVAEVTGMNKATISKKWRKVAKIELSRSRY